MKPSLIQILSGTLAAVSFTLCGCTNQQLLSPLARAFGEPPESELAVCRAAYARLQSRLPASQIQIEHVMFAPGHDRQWRSDLAQALAQEAGARMKAHFEAASGPPDVSFPQKMYHNQLRYLWDRSRDYARSVKAVPPGVDYLCFVEVFVGPQGNVAAIQVYLFESQGQLAYIRLYNNSHFGNDLSPEGDATIRFVAGSLLDIQRLAPEQAFPPYGIG
jgi:hypothetical protein